MGVVQMPVEVTLTVTDLLVLDEIRQEIDYTPWTFARNRNIHVRKPELRENRLSGVYVDHAPLSCPSADLLSFRVRQLDASVICKTFAFHRPNLDVIVVVKAWPVIYLESRAEQDPRTPRFSHHIDSAAFLADVLSDRVDDAATDGRHGGLTLIVYVLRSHGIFKSVYDLFHNHCV